MAINKEIENDYGVIFSYHKIKEVQILSAIEGRAAQIIITTESYKDKQARIDGKRPLIQKEILYGTDFALEPFYYFLKKKFPDFANGEDDFDNSFKTAIENLEVKYIQQSEDGKFAKINQEEAEIENDDISQVDTSINEGEIEE